MSAVGGQKRGLVDTELGDRADAVGVVDQRRAVLDHRVHHRPPAHPELGRHRRHRSGVGTHLAARLGPRPPCQHGLGVDVVGVLGPRLGLAVGLGAAPPALDPHQPCRSPEAGQIPDVDRHPVLGLGPHATAPAAHPLEHRLDGDDQLGWAFGDRQHPESVQSQKRLRQADTVVRHQGSPIAVAVEKPQRWRGPWPLWWMPATSLSPLQRGEPRICHLPSPPQYVKLGSCFVCARLKRPMIPSCSMLPRSNESISANSRSRETLRPSPGRDAIRVERVVDPGHKKEIPGSSLHSADARKQHLAERVPDSAKPERINHSLLVEGCERLGERAACCPPDDRAR